MKDTNNSKVLDRIKGIPTYLTPKHKIGIVASVKTLNVQSRKVKKMNQLCYKAIQKVIETFMMHRNKQQSKILLIYVFAH